MSYDWKCNYVYWSIDLDYDSDNAIILFYIVWKFLQYIKILNLEEKKEISDMTQFFKYFPKIRINYFLCFKQ